MAKRRTIDDIVAAAGSGVRVRIAPSRAQTRTLLWSFGVYHYSHGTHQVILATNLYWHLDICADGEEMSISIQEDQEVLRNPNTRSALGDDFAVRAYPNYMERGHQIYAVGSYKLFVCQEGIGTVRFILVRADKQVIHRMKPD